MRALVDGELKTSARIVAGGNYVVPRFLLDSPHGQLTAFCQWPQDTDAQSIAFGWIADLFRWRQVTAFLMSSELIEPPAVIVIYVSRSDTRVVLQTSIPVSTRRTRRGITGRPRSTT